jgi:hypothetical protein
MALVPMVALSGCLSNQGAPKGPSYSNDIVTIEDYYVSNLNPYAGSQVEVDFLLQNNGELPVSHLTLEVNAPAGWQITSLACQGITSPEITSEKDSGKCEYKYTNINEAIQPFDVRSVSMSFKTPSNILKPTPFVLSYSVSYDYTGYRKADLPVVDGVTLRKATSSYSESSPSYGPIRLDFDIPARSEHVEGKQVVKEYWGVKGEPFEIMFSFTDVASQDYKGSSAALSVNSITFDTKGSLKLAPGLPCDFAASGAVYVSSAEVKKMPGQLRCSFVSNDFAEPEIFATLWANYMYKYMYTKTQAFEVQPLSENP